jgi:hypothetical protein
MYFFVVALTFVGVYIHGVCSILHKTNIVSTSILHKTNIVSMNMNNESADPLATDDTSASDSLQNSISSGIFETCVRNGIVTLDREPDLPHVISDDLCVVRNAIYGIASLNHIHPFCKVC